MSWGRSWSAPSARTSGPRHVARSGHAPKAIKDAVGNVLADGDTVTVIKDLKIKGSSTVSRCGSPTPCQSRSATSVYWGRSFMG